MLKASFLFILAFLTGVAQARPQVLTHDQFVYLSHSQKNDFVIKIMELATELETRYVHEVKTSGFTQERFQKYSQLMKDLTSLLISSAYAEGDGTLVSWKKHADDFISIMNSAPEGAASDQCIYAGWPSRVRLSTIPKAGGGTETKNLCLHPKYIGGSTLPPESVAYLDSSDCQTRNQITCNPAIFGYKKAQDQSAFCVKAGIKDSVNSSLACMKAALAESPDADPAEKRLQFLRENLVKNKEVFEGVQKFVYKTCVCETNPHNINKDYHSYMRPHRTCYGLMQMMGSTIMCQTEGNLDLDTTIFKGLVEYTTKNSILTSSVPEDIDGLYKTYLGNVEPTPEYQLLCSGTKPEAQKAYECRATCESKSDAEYTCSFEIVEEGGDTPVTPSNEITEVPASKEDTTLAIKATINEKDHDLNCDVAFPTPEAQEKPSIKVTLGKKASTTQEVKAEVKGEKGPYKITWFRQGFPKDKKSKTKDKPKEKKKSPLAPDSDSEDEEAKPKEEKEEEKEKIDPDGPLSDYTDKTKVDEPLLSTVYKTCAKLTAEGQDDIKGNCVDIPKLEATASPAATGAPVQPPVMPRNSSSTSAMGIK